MAPVAREIAGGVHQERVCRGQDQALVEGKNGTVIRKLIGYGHIASEHSEELQKFYMALFNPYLNYHRPCGHATVTVDARGKRRQRCAVEDYILRKVRRWARQANTSSPGNTLKQLDAWAGAMGDTECAEKMNAPTAKLLRSWQQLFAYSARFL